MNTNTDNNDDDDDDDDGDDDDGDDDDDHTIIQEGIFLYKNNFVTLTLILC
jgi:hypothetical protein